MNYEYLIIGGGIAGVTAAETIREADGNGAIGIVSNEPHLVYSRVMLPSYLKKRIRREQVFLRTREDFAEKRIDLWLGKTAVAVDTGHRRVALASGEEIHYGKLLIAGGGKVNSWEDGEAGERIYRLQTLDDADRLFEALGAIRNPLVVGSSFIALEFVEIFLSNGIVPRVLSREERFFGRMLDAAGAELLEENFASRGVHLFLGDGVRGVQRQWTGLRISADRAGMLDADALAAGIGIARNIGFLTGSGIACGDGGIRTDEFLETNVPGVFAAGDIAEYYDPVAGRHRLVGNWTSAVLQGKRAGLNLAGRRAPFASVPSYAITNLGMQLTALGECDSRLDAVSRIDAAGRQYARFFLRGGALAGAFLINRFADKPHLAELIASQTGIGRFVGSLRDMSFDIRSIPAIQ